MEIGLDDLQPGEAILVLRRRQSLSQEALGRAVSCSGRWIRAIEAGRAPITKRLQAQIDECLRSVN